MTDLTTSRFADYATSGAFAIGLTRGQIATLALIAGGDHNPAPHMATIGALERQVRSLTEAGRIEDAAPQAPPRRRLTANPPDARRPPQ